MDLITKWIYIKWISNISYIELMLVFLLDNFYGMIFKLKYYLALIFHRKFDSFLIFI